MKLLCHQQPNAFFTFAFRKHSNANTVFFFALFLFIIQENVHAQLAQFNFPATSSLQVSAKESKVTVSDVSLSTGTIETNIVTGSYFANEPYIEESGGWTATTQATAKNFQFTITANAGYTFSITNIAFNAYATSTGPSAFGFAIGASDIYAINAPSASLVVVSQGVSGYTGLSSAIIKFQGWSNLSRTTTGAGAFKLDDIIITGTVASLCTPPTSQAFGLNFSGITSSQQTLDFTRGNGTGGVLVVGKNSNPATAPASGTSYSASLSFGSGDLIGGGRAVYNDIAAGISNATSKTVTNLSPESHYYYNFYEWDYTNTCYNLTPLTGNGWTLSSVPSAHPSSFSATAASSTQIDLSFSAASSISNADGYIILGRSDGVTPTTSGITNGVPSTLWSLPIGTSIVANINSTTTSSYSHASLTSATTYCYLIIPYNWNGTNTETYNYYSTVSPLTTCATSSDPFAAGDYRTNPLFTGTYYFDSEAPDGFGNYPWQKWAGAWTDVTTLAGTPQLLTTKPPTIYLNGIHVDIAGGGTYNNIIIEGPSTNVYSANTSTGLTIAPGATLEIVAGTLNVTGKMELGTAALLHIYASANFKINSAASDFLLASTSVIEVEDDANFYIQSYLSNLWAGEERFHKNSNLFVQGWDNNPLTYLISAAAVVSTYSEAGFAACFGNLIINMGSSSNNQQLQLLPDGFTNNLTHNHLIFRTAAAGTGFSIALINSGSYSTTIGGNLTVEDTWINKPISLLNNLGTVAVTIKGNVENRSSYSAILKACESSIASTSVTLNIEGDFKLSNSGIFDFNTAASGTGAVTSKINLNGDLFASSGTTLLTTYVNSNGNLNFTGSGNGSTPALTQTIDITSTAISRNKQITFIINPLPSTTPFVQLNHDLELGTKSTITAKSAGTFDFSFVGTTPNIVKIVSGAGSTKFTSEQGSVLKISSADGIIKNTTTYGISKGNVQGISTTNRTYNTLATFWYTGKTNQTTGDGINSTGSTSAIGKVVIVELSDNSISLTPTVSFGVSNNTNLSTTGGKLDIRKGQFIETTTAYIFPATGFTGGTLYMSPGTLYQIAKGNNSAALSNADLIPRMDGTTHPYNIQGTIDFTGTGADAFQTIRGLRRYRAVKFSGANTYGTDYKNLSNTVTVDSALIITNSVVDCIDGVANPIPFSGTGGLTMTNGTLRLKALNNANPELTGTYTGSTYSLTGGTVEFYGSTAIQQQQIRGNYDTGALVKTITYKNVEINAAAANYNAVIANAGNVDLNSSFILNGIMNVNSPAVLRMDKEESISGTGTFNLNSGAGLLYGGSQGSASSGIEGLEASGTSVDAGNIRTSNRNLSPLATYGFVSPGNMPTGSGLPSTVAGIFVYKTNSADQVTLTNPTSVAANGVLNLSSGQLATSAARLLTLDATSTITGGNTNSSFVNGPLLWNTAGPSTYLFPVGKSNINRSFNFTTTGNYGATFTGEYFTGTPPLGALLGPSLQGIVNTEYWQLERGGISSTKGILSLNYVNPGAGQWSDGAGGSATDPVAGSTVQVAKRSTAAGPQPWYFTIPDVAAASEYTPYDVNDTINSREVSSFSYFTLGYSFSIVLPVRLLSFDAHAFELGGALNWKVTDSRNLAGFELQHSTNGLNFSKLANIALSNSNLYGYVHPVLPEGAHYYRLLVKQIDGENFYSTIKMLSIKKPKTTIASLLNTIATTDVSIKIFSVNNQSSAAVITNLLGQQLAHYQVRLQKGINTWRINTESFAKGMYMITILTDDKTKETFRFVKD